MLADEEAAWVAEALGRSGRRPSGEPVSVRAYPWSQVARVPTDAGDAYLKQIDLSYSAEPEVLTALADWFPGQTPDVLAVDTTRRWILMDDAGTPLREALKEKFAPERLAQALVRMAEIQKGTIGRVDDLLKLGLADWRLARLPALYLQMVEAGDLPERAELLAFAPRVEKLCAALAACGVPETIEHCDFHDNNVLVRDERMTVADWGDAVIAHPFLSLASCLISAERNHLLPDADAPPIAAPYLAAWRDVAPMDRLEKAASLANHLRPIQVALNFARVIDAAPMADIFANVIEGSLHGFLEAERLTSDRDLGYA